jgi:hypothetical protein
MAIAHWVLVGRAVDWQIMVEGGRKERREERKT